MFAVFGSAGDLFPLMPTMSRLRASGFEIVCATSPALSLYCRTVGIPSLTIGSALDLVACDDPNLVTVDRDGWRSFRELIRRYLLPELRDVYLAVRRWIREWRPTLVVATSLAVAARLAALAEGVPVLDTNMYPLHFSGTDTLGRLPDEYLSAVTELAAVDRPKDLDLLYLALGEGPATVVLHDRALSPDIDVSAQVVGYPYWDGHRELLRSTGVEPDRLFDRKDTTVAVVFGSFLGRGQSTRLSLVDSALKSLGVRALFLGAPKGWVSERDAKSVRSVPYSPLLGVLPECDAVVHHGGLGTSLAAVHCGLPSVIMPLAFDQPLNGRLMSNLGVARLPDPGQLQSSIEEVLADDAARLKTSDLAASLVSPTMASSGLTQAVMSRVAAGGATRARSGRDGQDHAGGKGP